MKKNINRIIAEGKELTRDNFYGFKNISNQETYISETLAKNPRLKMRCKKRFRFSSLFWNGELDLIGFENYLKGYNPDNFDQTHVIKNILTDLQKSGSFRDVIKYIKDLEEAEEFISKYIKEQEDTEILKAQEIQEKEDEQFRDPFSQGYKKFKVSDNPSDVICIYMIYESNTKKYYIGSTNNLKKRIAQHLSELRSEKHHSFKLQEVFNQYGESSLTYYILEVINKQQFSNSKKITKEEQYKKLKIYTLKKEQEYINRFHPSLNVLNDVFEYQKRFGGQWY